MLEHHDSSTNFAAVVVPIDTSERFSKVIAMTLAFPMEHVLQRYLKDNGLPMDVAREHEIEFKKYIALCVLHPKGGLGVSRVIDELWHTFIIFTPDYHRFCEMVAGRYLHHQPTTEEDLKDGKNINDYARTLSVYKTYFGEPPVHLWPVPNTRPIESNGCDQSGCGNGCSSSTCNQHP